MVPPESPVAPTEPAASAGPYQVPDARVLSERRDPGLAEEDRSELQARLSGWRPSSTGWRILVSPRGR